MITRKNKPFDYGYTSITEKEGRHPEMLLDFGILKMKAGDVHTDAADKERAWLLIEGEVSFSWEGNGISEASGARFSCFDENPVVFHAPARLKVDISAVRDCEIAVEMCENPNHFAPTFFDHKDVRCDIFGKGTLNETAIRTVRTVFDGETAPLSNMVLGEVINHPGKWSSYPPHDHPHPEIYHYRFFPKQGFGISLLDEKPYLVKDGDSSLILPNKTHSQVAGAGYAMYYIWMIPHLPEDRWLPTTRYFRKEHEWMLEKGVEIWPERKYG